MGIVICYLHWRIHIAIPFAVVIYCAAIFLIKGVNKEDISLVRESLSYRKAA